MLRSPLPAALLALLALGLVLPACGGGGDVGPTALTSDPSSPPSTPFVPTAPPSLWADDGCAVCHGPDGAGAVGPSIQCTSFERLDAHLRTTTTSHVGGAFPNLTDADLLDLVAFLRTADCPGTLPGDPTSPPTSGGVPATHTENEDGVLHHPDYETNLATCTQCHGANLEGTTLAPACASCHGSGGGFDDDVFDEPDDNGGTGETETETEIENEIEND